MENRLSMPAVPGVITYLNNGALSTEKSVGGASVDMLVVTRPGVTSGDFVHPNAFSFEKVSGTGLRGQTVQTASVDSGPILRTGGYQSPLHTNGRIGREGLNFPLPYNLALAQLNEKLRGNLDLSINLFQAKQLLTSGEKVFRLTKTLRDSFYEIVKRRGPVKELASLYLEWIYGIKPVLQDMFSLYDQLYKKGESDEGLIHFRGRGKYVSRSSFGYLLNIMRSSDFDAAVTFDCDLSHRGQLDVYFSPIQSDLQKLSHYTSLNPIAWLYEMTPYSFVLDWFYDFGGYLRNLETVLLHRTRFVYGCYTQTVLETTTLRENTVRSGTFEFSGGTGSHVYKWYDRSVATALDVPKPPSWRPSLGATRMLNSAALLAQFLPDMFSKRHGRIRTDGRQSPLGARLKT